MATIKRRQPNAATVSKVLREAGYTKASEANGWGFRQTEGFLVSSIAYQPAMPVQVLDTNAKWSTKSEGRLREMAATLTEAGYLVVLDESPKSGWLGSFWIKRWDA